MGRIGKREKIIEVQPKTVPVTVPESVPAAWPEAAPLAPVTEPDRILEPV